VIESRFDLCRACRYACALTAFALLVVAHVDAPRAQTAVFFQESFEDTAFASRGWYDAPGGVLSTAEKYSGSRSLECRFSPGGTKCASPARHLFPASDSVYLSYYIKHTANWVGSGRNYHPHMFNFVTNVDGAFIGPAYTHLTTYVEENSGYPVLAIQDGMNIDEKRIGQDLTDISEQRSVAGCNGDSDGHGDGSCYASGSVHFNGKMWRPSSVYFGNMAGSPTYKGDWHLVEAFFKLNSVVGGKGVNDGIIRYWYDGNLIIELSDIAMRTGIHPTMKFNQFLFLPFIGDGSPVDQTFWIDDVVVASVRPATPPVPPRQTSSAPATPTNLRIVVP
jgi:hypothetical protein